MNTGQILLVRQGGSSDSPPTADVRVRQAIAAAIDPAALNERVYEGTRHPSTALVSDRSTEAATSRPTGASNSSTPVTGPTT